MPEILTFTPNPSIDVFTTVDKVIDTRKMRCGAERRDPGGGGVNVARVVQRLGGSCTAVVMAGGQTGAMLRQLLEAEQVATACVDIAGHTRESFSVLETSTGREFRFVLPGPVITGNDWQRCLDAVAAFDPAPRFLVLSGRLPPGAPIDGYAQLARAAAGRGTQVALDTSGPALAAALEAGVAIVKPSVDELRELTGEPLADEAQWCEAARQIVRDGRARIVALTLGGRGALLVERDRVLRAPALPVRMVSAIGAGDSFLAALVWALNRGAGTGEAFRYGMAAAAAALLSAGTGLCRWEDVERLYHEASSHPTALG
ncbi:1-phosphofructokinase family hexose kinase [Pandoraea sp.]|uniref:1-phosphofructokinase family hexose kinase n=1 Tax=Pandoraea sp. TaxID=1883445 RepID=UPI001218BF6B|nr:1-phosphofructokinase family hexose kinase [Pandoraea sp.]TAL52867.1 MAG: 1-phosphofructokinase family hexose kinase [Pandoraea sp.]TAM19688.1 MAG: 1-phosphofructokinase family hexose kinase [Pandoraea sp.]